MTDGTITVRNAYNSEGGRIAKIVNRSYGSETHRYTYNNGKLVYDIIRINDHGEIRNETVLLSYDESGRPFMITYNNISYYYLLNAQGDVIGIMNVNGALIVEYTYDAWGKLLSISGNLALGKANPLRYRGYVYDQETGLYYLNSRYYNPTTGRFINADNYPSTGQGLTGNNMFAYCGNNPISRIDDGGEFWNVVIGAVVGAVVGAVTTAVQTYKETGKVNIGKTIISAAVGAVSGGVAATGLGAVAQAAITAGATFVGDVATQKICENKAWNKINYTKSAHNAVLAGGTSLLGSALGSITSAGHTTAGNTLISTAKDKLLTGYVKKSVGQSSSHLIRQGQKLLSAGMKYINTGRGISSVTGTILTWGLGQKYAWG